MSVSEDFCRRRHSCTCTCTYATLVSVAFLQAVWLIHVRYDINPAGCYKILPNVRNELIQLRLITLGQRLEHLKGLLGISRSVPSSPTPSYLLELDRVAKVDYHRWSKNSQFLNFLSLRTVLSLLVLLLILLRAIYVLYLYSTAPFNFANLLWWCFECFSTIGVHCALKKFAISWRRYLHIDVLLTQQVLL